MNFYISDLHFGHKNILSFDNRPFADVDTHDVVIINRWNSVVGIDDDVYILGDISWHNATKTIEIFNKLNGNKHLIIGNHDRKMLRNKDVRSLFVEIVDYKEITFDDGNGLVLCHYPIPTFNNHYYGWYHFYGHVHVSWEANIVERLRKEMEELYGVPCNMYNVGCMLDYMEFTPKTFEQIVSQSTQHKWYNYNIAKIEAR